MNCYDDDGDDGDDDDDVFLHGLERENGWMSFCCRVPPTGDYGPLSPDLLPDLKHVL